MISWRNVRKLLLRLIAVVVLLSLIIGFFAWYKLFRQVPQQFANTSAEEYFKYGSIGTEEGEGLPYYVWLVLPRIFPEYLPKDSEGRPHTGGYAAFGFGWEQGHETPVGFSRKSSASRHQHEFALCHSTTFRTSPDALPTVVPTGPTQRGDPQAYIRFVTTCGSDPRFNADNLLYEISYNIKLSWCDKLLYRYVIIPQTRKALRRQRERFAWTNNRPRWDPDALIHSIP